MRTKYGDVWNNIGGNYRDDKNSISDENCWK